MNKQEFEQRTGKAVSDRDYKVIELVYTWHPAISETEGKDQIAAIFNAGGMGVIRDMVETAEMAMSLDNERRELERKMSILRERADRLVSGDKSFEKCRKDVEKAFDSSENQEQLEKAVKELEGIYGEQDVREARKQLGV